ncbi:MAG: hypothetical protein AAFO94_17500, partial [Bacteroidota bacterium]
MKNLCFLLLIFGLFGFSNPPQGAKGTLVVSVENVNKQSGDLRLGLYISKSSYDAEDNPDYWIVHKVESTGAVHIVDHGDGVFAERQIFNDDADGARRLYFMNDPIVTDYWI